MSGFHPFHHRVAMIAAVVVLGATCLTHAAQITVDSRSGPWQWVIGGLNANYRYGIIPNSSPMQPATLYSNVALAPAVVSINQAGGLPFTPGDTLTFGYVSGTWSVSNTGNPLFPFEGPNGNPSSPWTGYAWAIQPLYYIPSSEWTLYNESLLGTFADASGAIVGTPHAVYCQFSDVSFTIPAGATQFLLGSSDGYSLDNAGSLTIRVTETPEPGSLCLLTLGGLAVLRRKR